MSGRGAARWPGFDVDEHWNMIDGRWVTTVETFYQGRMYFGLAHDKAENFDRGAALNRALNAIRATIAFDDRVRNA